MEKGCVRFRRSEDLSLDLIGRKISLESVDAFNANLFATQRRPIRRLMPHQIWCLVTAIGARAGLRERVWPHRLRHTLGTTLLNSGADLVAVQSILGHEKPETTQIYATLSGVNRQQAYRRHFIQEQGLTL